MNAKKSPRQRPRLSFAVDREEIDISSDWVEAVMESPAPVESQPSFFVPEAKTTTVEHVATVEPASTVEVTATVAPDATVALDTTVEPIATVEPDTTVALLSRPS